MPRAAPAEAAIPAANADARPSRLSGIVGYHLRLAQEASFAAFLRRVGDPALKPGRYSVLTVIADNPGLTPTALARACGRDKSTLTPALKDLVQHGFVRREEAPGDARSYRISLTPSGQALLGELRRHADAHDRLLDRIVGSDKALLLTLLDRIATVLSEGDVAPMPVGARHPPRER